MILYNSKEQFGDCISDTKYVNRCWLYLRPALMLLKSRDVLLKSRAQMTACSIENETLCLYFKLKPTNIDLLNCIKVLQSNNELVDEGIFSKSLHKIRVKPDISYNAFLEGNYSQIYTKDQIQICFPEESKIKQVITKNKDYEDEYFQFLRKCFGNSLRKTDIVMNEYDIPPCLNQEIYNYDSSRI